MHTYFWKDLMVQPLSTCSAQEEFELSQYLSQQNSCHLCDYHFTTLAILSCTWL